MRFLKLASIVSFEAALGLYVITNGILTLNPEAAVLYSLWNLVGNLAIVGIVFQIIAGVLLLVGLLERKANIEVAGIAIIVAAFCIRIIALLADRDVSLQDINAICLSFYVVIGCLGRVAIILIEQFKE